MVDSSAVPTDELSPLEEEFSPLASVEAAEGKDEELDEFEEDEELVVDEEEELDELEELEAAVDEELVVAVHKLLEANKSPMSYSLGQESSTSYDPQSDEEEAESSGPLGGTGAGVSEAESRGRSRSPRRPPAKSMPVPRSAPRMLSWMTCLPLGPPPAHLLAPPGPSTSFTSTATGLAVAALPGPLDPVHPLHPLPPTGPGPLRDHPPGPLCPLQPVPMFGLPADLPPGPLPEATAQVQLVVCLMVV
jgi:hypothetical protein